MTKKSADIKRPFVFTILLCLFMFLQLFLSEDIRAGEENVAPTFSLKFRDMEIRDVLGFLARESARNIVIPDDLAQKVTLDLDNISLEDALFVILKSHGYTYVMERGVIRVAKLSESESQGTAEDIYTEIIALNFAKADKVLESVKGVLTKRGNASVDIRSNSIIVRDVENGAEAARQLLMTLDTRSTQVLIKAKIVEANSSFSRNLGIQWGGKYVGGSNTYTGGAGLPLSPGGNNFAVNLPATDATSGLGMSIGSISNSLTLDIQLSAAEDRGDVNIVSKPSITTVNNMPAEVSSGVEYTVKTTVNTGGSVATEGVETVEANTSLKVTPQISADGHILLTIEASRDEPDFTRIVEGRPVIISKHAKTTVLVKDGETTVIGGMQQTKNSKGQSSVPFLSKIPVLGWLFKSKNKSEENDELLIFITPKIIKEFG